MIYDSFLVFGVLFTATIPAVFLKQQPQVTNNEVVHDLTPLVHGWAFQLYLIFVFTCFYCWFWRKNQQTLGMQAWRLRVETFEGGTISIGQCLIRLLGACISLACLGAGYWWAWIDRDGLSWHDRWSKSRIVLLPKKGKAASTGPAQEPQTDDDTDGDR